MSVRRWPDLTDAERREIELAENLDRKDLSQAELNRNLARLADTAAEVLRDEARFSPTVSKNPNGGRPANPASEEKIAERIGVPRQTINLAKRHVAAIDSYPELTPLPQVDALKIAAKLDAMPEGHRRIECRRTGCPSPILAIVPELTDATIADAMVRAERVACRPGEDRCWSHPYDAAHAPCDRKGRCVVGWISRDSGREAWDVLLDTATGEGRLHRLPDLR